MSNRNPTLQKQNVLSQKELDLLSLIYEYDGLNTDLILRATHTNPSARSYAYSCISRLAQKGYLNRIRLPSLTGVGSGQSFFTLGPEGRKTLASLWEVPRSTLIRKEIPTGLIFLAHHLQSCSTRLAIAQATASPDAPASLVEWQPERHLRAHPFRVVIEGSPHILIPDAYFILSSATNHQAGFCLETDMGTLSKRRWAEKIILYGRSSLQAILVTVPNTKRKEELLQLTVAVTSSQGADQTRFWFADINDLTPSTILIDPVWTIPDIGASPLLPSPFFKASETVQNAPKTAEHHQSHDTLHPTFEK